MLKKVTYSIISFSMLATSLGIVNANAEESSKVSQQVKKEQWVMATNNI